MIKTAFYMLAIFTISACGGGGSDSGTPESTGSISFELSGNTVTTLVINGGEAVADLALVLSENFDLNDYSLVVTTDNPTLLPKENITLTETTSSYAVSIEPIEGQSGSVKITVKATHLENGAVVTASLTLTIEVTPLGSNCTLNSSTLPCILN